MRNINSRHCQNINLRSNQKDQIKVLSLLLTSFYNIFFLCVHLRFASTEGLREPAFISQRKCIYDLQELEMSYLIPLRFFMIL